MRHQIAAALLSKNRQNAADKKSIRNSLEFGQYASDACVVSLHVNFGLTQLPLPLKHPIHGVSDEIG
jgi:hypothetical protein